jgi:hypothetical protein
MPRFLKTPLTAAAVLSLITTTTQPVLAHECFNASRTDKASEIIAQHSHGWFDIQVSQFLAIGIASCIQNPGGDCPPPPPLSPQDMTALQNGNLDQLIGEILGFIPAEPAITNLLAFTTLVQNEAACLGVPTHFLTLANATAAGGTEKGNSNSDVTSDGKGIDHFPEAYGPQLFQAIGTVLSGTPSACH